MHMCDAFAHLGHDTQLIHIKPSDEPKADPAHAFEFYGLRCSFTMCAVARSPIRYWGLLSYSITGFARHVWRSQADLVYCRDFLGALVSAWMRYRTVFELHAMPDSPLTRHCLHWICKAPGLARIVVISEALKHDLLAMYPELERKTVVAHDAASEVPTTQEEFPVLPQNDDHLMVGYVGGLYKGKGTELIIEIARLLPEMEFHIVGGSGPLLDTRRDSAKDVQNVFFHGYKPHAEIPRYVASFDIVLLPNQQQVKTFSGGTDIGRWTSPLKMFEYMAAEKPIICSDLPVLREVMDHDRNCLVCSPEAPAEWARALRKLASNAPLRRELAAQARNDFVTKYTWTRRAERILDSL